MDLLEKIQASEADRAAEFTRKYASAEKTYREILERADAPRKHDADDLLAAVGVLSLTSSDVARDLKAIAEAREITGRLLDDDAESAVKDEAARIESAVTEEQRAVLLQFVRGLDARDVVVLLDYIQPRLSKSHDELCQWRDRQTEWVSRADAARRERDERLRQNDHDRARLRTLRREFARVLPASRT